ncbi:helix-turn-helix transcriptional regulator [Alkalihalophilus lindianensis]|uniref:Helix-turn-helix transcriptional regulator n=1 Tax=Alkalihalophilus lindianensis TaxID=1630542 RepID=A0ABU3XF13_9BACI|nr:helix-turn-helix transcriptional regulator [Alkalihalophilus lindianensis]MDV2686479.1 helix-turn-helix transcriptional regulator [Alkalihalophilus lindianensis]
MGKQEKDPLLESFGIIVRTRRNRAGLTIEELAWRSGLTVTYISQIENGIRNTSLEIIMKLAAALELDHPGILINEDIQEAYEDIRAPIQQRIDESK